MDAPFSFTHRFQPALRSEVPPLLLLHGTGGNEDDLLPLGRMVAPGAALLSPRGKVLEGEMPRFFRRISIGVFDEDDVRLLEVLAGQASVALENARLYEQQRREAESAKALLAFADVVSRAHTVEEICAHTVQTATSLFEVDQVSLWLGDTCVAHVGEPVDEGVTSPLPQGPVGLTWCQSSPDSSPG